MDKRILHTTPAPTDNASRPQIAMIPQQQQKPPLQQQSKLILQHPFTMLIAGPTSCGKTMWIAQLLQLSNTMINPAPTRILYFYKRWQPLYDEIMKHVPHIEFVEGIPHNVKEDSYFDTKFPTLFILDDQMRDSAKSSDICELFTEGSHHRNLSVICLMQNLFYQGKESRTMSLNTQYLVLFKSPRDKQQISILARQMYPNRSHYFIEQYEKATQRPHGYLFVDLKQTTSEEDRLKSDIFHNVPDREHQIRPLLNMKLSQLGEGPSQPIPPPGIPANDKIMRNPIMREGNLSDHVTEHLNVNNMDDSTDSIHSMTGHGAGNMSNACDDCGIVFNHTRAVQKHVKRGCPEDDGSDNKIPFQKQRKIELIRNWKGMNDRVMNGRGDDDSNDDDSDDDDDADDGGVKDGDYGDDDDIGFHHIMNIVFEKLNDEYVNKVDQYMKKGANRKEAISEANTIMRPAFRKGLVSEYKDFLTLTRDLNKSRLHRDIMKHLQLAKDFNIALKRLIRTHISEFDMMIDSAEESDENSDDDDDDDEESSDDDDDDDDENAPMMMKRQINK